MDNTIVSILMFCISAILLPVGFYAFRSYIRDQIQEMLIKLELKIKHEINRINESTQRRVDDLKTDSSVKLHEHEAKLKSISVTVEKILDKVRDLKHD